MGIIGTLLLVFTTIVTIKFLPNLFFNVSWNILHEIMDSKSLEAISSLLKSLGWIDTTAKEDATRIYTICFIVAVILIILMLRTIIKSQKNNSDVTTEKQLPIEKSENPQNTNSEIKESLKDKEDE